MKKVRLPYINNAKAVLITMAINLGVLFIFNWPDGIDFKGVMADAVVCACITTLINLWMVYACLKKMRASGQMPQQAPVSRLMQKLPKNPFALGFLYALFFAALTMGINWVVLTFFDMHNMAFIPWMTYKLIYSTVLSIKIVEFCIFRYVQPDWAKNTNEHLSGQSVKNPFPKIGLFKEMYGGVTLNLVANIVMGSVFGSVITQTDGSIVLLPTTIEGIPITGLIFGLIIGILITNGVVKSMKASILAAGQPILQTASSDRRFTWMPKRTGALMCLITISMMLFSAVALPSLMYLFGKQYLNFLQFTIVITLYATLVSRPLSWVLIRRCMQRDFINRIIPTI